MRAEARLAPILRLLDAGAGWVLASGRLAYQTSSPAPFAGETGRIIGVRPVRAA